MVVILEVTGKRPILSCMRTSWKMKQLLCVWLRKIHRELPSAGSKQKVLKVFPLPLTSQSTVGSQTSFVSVSQEYSSVKGGGEFNLNKHLVQMWARVTPSVHPHRLCIIAFMLMLLPIKIPSSDFGVAANVSPLKRFCSVWACWIAAAASPSIYFWSRCRSGTSRLIWISATVSQTINISMNAARLLKKI